MTDAEQAMRVEAQIRQWREQLQRARKHDADALTALEARLRAHLAGLATVGLATDEALLLAFKRVGDDDASTRDYARAQVERLWPATTGASAAGFSWLGTDALVALGLAVLAAFAIKLPEWAGWRWGNDELFYARNLSLFVLPFVALYFVWRRGAGARTLLALAGAFVIAAVFANVYPLESRRYPVELTALHLPIALWLAIGIAHAGGRWREVSARMEFVRFSGELFIHYVLIALGGMVFTLLMMLLFHAIGVDMEPVFAQWLLPCGAVGAVVIAAWLVDARLGAMAPIAPLLTRLFTPLFTLLLLAFLATMAVSGRALAVERDLLIALDLLLVVVLGLLLYAMSARDPRQPPGAFDVLQVVLVIAALVVDALALWAISARISEFGFTPNRVAALGENLLLLVNLAGCAVFYLRFLAGHSPFTALERWQTRYLPLYSLWAALVVITFPPLFGYV